MRPLPDAPRRGLTLIEMLVVVALVVLLMTTVVTVFAAATGAVSAQRTYQALDEDLRRLDATLRADLRGVTAKLDPARPDGSLGLDPDDNLGYFEYGENAFADAQGEDTDDYLAFTAQAPPGRPFVGRMLLPVPHQGLRPVAIASNLAEIIYFLRAGNLYRRVLLVVPERAGAMTSSFGTLNGAYVSWQAVNDISARPSPYAGTGVGGAPAIRALPVPNSLGDLTNRENRFARPRFSDDFLLISSRGSWSFAPDGVPDDLNNDGVPDFYPTLYPGVFRPANAIDPVLVPNPAPYPPALVTADVMAFPYIYPHAYSQEAPGSAAIGALHGLDPSGASSNHAPLEQGDSLAIPAAGASQSWWGFPTWRETASLPWIDPIWQVNGHPLGASQQSAGLTCGPASLPPVPLRTRLDAPGSGRPTFLALPFADGAGASAFGPNNAGVHALDYYPDSKTHQAVDPDLLWEDDLILSGVRSFDVKVLDPEATVYNPSPAPGQPHYVGLGSGYYDLGYEAAPGFFPSMAGATPSGLLGTFSHEGRIPPLTADGRADAHWPGLLANVGNDHPDVLRLRRVFDTWSTDYSRAPDVPLDPRHGPPFAPPAYPSYPPPYPAPLRGLQIQVRAVDPKNQRIKVLTIRQDFSDKL